MKKLMAFMTGAGTLVEMLRLIHLHAPDPHLEKEQHTQPKEPAFTASASGTMVRPGIGTANARANVVGFSV